MRWPPITDNVDVKRNRHPGGEAPQTLRRSPQNTRKTFRGTAAHVPGRMYGDLRPRESPHGISFNAAAVFNVFDFCDSHARISGGELGPMCWSRQTMFFAFPFRALRTEHLLTRREADGPHRRPVPILSRTRFLPFLPVPGICKADCEDETSSSLCFKSEISCFFFF